MNLKKDWLRIEHVNAQSLLSSLDEVKLLLTDRNIDVLGISETWLHANTPDGYVDIQGYKIFRRDNGRGGGVCLYVNSSLNPSIITPGVPEQVGVEDVWVQVQCRKLPSMIIGCVYRHPKALTSSFDYMQEVFKVVCLRGKSVFIMGDFNDNMLVKGNRMSKIIRDNKLTQIIDKPTRITSHSATLLDLIITNKPEMILSHEVVPHVIADHHLVSVVINVKKPRKIPVIKTFQDMKHYDKDTFCLLLLDNLYSLNDVFLTDDVNKQVYIFNELFSSCLEICAPVVTRTVKGTPAPWMSSDIREAMKNRDKLQKQLNVDTHNVELRERYKTAKRYVKTLINTTKTEHYQDRLRDCKGNTSATWKVIDEIIPNQKNKNNTHNFTNMKEKVEEFNNFFSSVGESAFRRSQEKLRKEVDMVNRPHINNYNVNSFFRPNPVDVNTVILIVKDLNATNSIGSDGIALRFLRDALCVIVPYLTCIVNTSLVTGVFPESWKHALVVPLYKNGDPDIVNNYRPVSILPVVSKILEKIVAKQLSEYLEENKLLSNTQHGFRPMLSTETALTTITDKIYESMDNKKIAMLTLCDLSKAFDSVHHQTLLHKCSLLNIDEFWFNNYLDNRSMSVRLDNHVSKKTFINYGVPQGSILGPILFNIYVNDLAAYVNGFVVQYADDTQFLHSSTINNLDQLIKDTEETLAQCRMYYLKNGLMFNSCKTQCIFIGNRQLLCHIPPNTTVNFNGNIIYPSKHVKNLGVYFDRHMLFDVHISELNKKVMGILMFASRISDKLDKKSRVMVIQAIVLSLINYCIKIWGTTNDTLLHNVQKLQNFAVRIAIGGVKKYDHISTFYDELQWLTVKQRKVFELGTTIFKVLRGFYPDWFMILTNRQDITSSVTRQGHTLHVSRSHTHTGDRRTAISGARLWNALPPSLTHETSINCFKTRLKEILLTENIFF